MAASRSSGKSRSANGVVAWVALLMATLALAVALSDQAWLQAGLQRWRQNWSLLQTEVQRSREPEPAESDAAAQLRQASTAARLGDTPEVRARFREALEALRGQARALEGDVRERADALIEEMAALSDSIRAGAESARTLTAFAQRAEALSQASGEAERPHRSSRR